MTEVRNLAGKRICDISEDREEIVIEIKDCRTVIRAEGNKLIVTQEKKKENR